MWVRSQDKLFLDEVKRIIILSPSFYRKNFEIVNYIALRPNGEQDTCDDYDTLGKYDTRERALEVLNDIELTIRESNQCTVYQMPEN